MPNMLKILSECRDENLQSLCIGDTETGEYAKWWQYPFVDIDYSRLRKGMTELPVHKETLGYVTIVLHSIAFRLHPTDHSKVQVIDLSKAQKRGLFDESNNPMTKVYSYSNNSVGRPFTVNLGTKIEVVTQLLKLLRIHRSGGVGRPEGRVRLDYGDVNTLQSWGETCDVAGYIGSTSGKERSFILVSNSRSMGGGTIMTDCILSIRDTRKKRLYSKSSENTYRYHYILNEALTNPLRKIK